MQFIRFTAYAHREEKMTTNEKCPTCGKTGFTNKSYMKRHHKIVHGKTLKQKTTCHAKNCQKETYNDKFCSQKCMGKTRQKHNTTECQHPDCKKQVYNGKYCSRTCANKNTWKQRDNPAKRKNVRQKISEKQKGKKNNFYGKKHTEEALQKISKSNSGKNHHYYGVTGKDHPRYGMVSGLKMQTVKETGHTVRSNWEKEIDLMLHNANINYEYESKTFELTQEITYTPDFIISDKIIEVKGWPTDKSIKRAKLFMKKHPNHKYIVVGNKIPCDIHIEWENREKLLQHIKNKEHENET